MKQTMKALVWQGQGTLALQERPVPTVQAPQDAVVEVTLSTICTSDLHILRGAVPRAVPGTVLGHEFVGRVVQAGEGVPQLSPGDRVAANCITFCGDCWFCRRGYINNCTVGGWELGCRIDGCQAEYVRVPFAHTGLTKIPDGVSDENALFLGDILSTGYFGAQLCEIRPGDTVAIIGAGPVGLCSAQCARLMGASRILLLDIQDSRLAFARSRQLADVYLNPRREDAKAAVLQLSQGRGADGVIEAAGGEDTFQLAWELARPNAVVALVAMYERDQILPLPQMYGKNLVFKTGGVDASHCGELMELVSQGKLDTDYLITHTGTLDEILTGYRVFGDPQEHCMKWAVTPGPCRVMPGE